MQTISITNDPNEMWDEWKHISHIFLTLADRHAFRLLKNEEMSILHGLPVKLKI